MSATPIEQVVGTFQKWLHLPKPEALIAVLGAVAANRLPGDPVWLMVVGPPGGGKSEILQSLNGLKDIRGVGTLTERALLSGTAKKEVDKDSKGGLLREIGAFGIIVCKDFGSLLSGQRDERQKTMAALREVYDGSWTRDVGVDGGRKLYWQGKVGLIAGVTPAIDQHQMAMGAMGERFVMLRLPTSDPTAQARRALAHAGHEDEMRSELRDAVSDLFQSVNGIVPTNDAESEHLIALATLVARARSAVIRDSRNNTLELVPGSEAPTRLIVALDRLLGGMKVLGIPDGLCQYVITRVALDSIPALRRELIEKLFLTAGEPTETGVLADAVRYPTETVRRTLYDLSAHYVVELEREGSGNAHRWRLSDWAQRRMSSVKLAEASSESSTYPSRYDQPANEEPMVESNSRMRSSSEAKKARKAGDHLPPIPGVVLSESISTENSTEGFFDGEEPPE